MQGSPLPLLATTEQQPGVRTPKTSDPQQPGDRDPKYPASNCFSLVCVVFWSCSAKTARVGTPAPEEAKVQPQPFDVDVHSLAWLADQV